MSNGFAKAVVLGNLTADIDVRYTTNGDAVGTFTLAVNSRRKVNNEYKDEVSFLDFVMFGSMAENIARLKKKGACLLVDCIPKQRRWDDKETGKKRAKVEFMVRDIIFPPNSGKHTEETAAAEPAPVGEEEIPY